MLIMRCFFSKQDRNENRDVSVDKFIVHSCEIYVDLFSYVWSRIIEWTLSVCKGQGCTLDIISCIDSRWRQMQASLEMNRQQMLLQYPECSVYLSRINRKTKAIHVESGYSLFLLVFHEVFSSLYGFPHAIARLSRPVAPTAFLSDSRCAHFHSLL